VTVLERRTALSGHSLSGSSPLACKSLPEKPADAPTGATAIKTPTVEHKGVRLRNLDREDEADWRRLWAGYNEFYRASVAPEVTAFTWKRVLDPAIPLLGRGLETDTGLAGFSLSVLHEGTWVAGKVCYMEDLFVDPRCRGQGYGRLLIEDLIELAAINGWSTLYWHTQQGNTARRLYDSFIAADDFVRYRMRFSR